MSRPPLPDHPWHITRKYGFGVNLEQNLTRNLTAFARFGWDNGKAESFAYTEVDQTFAEGLGANGAWWHRKGDWAGIAFISNAIKKDPPDLSRVLGDGKLNCGRENILETYCTVHVWGGFTSLLVCNTSTIPATTVTAGPSWSHHSVLTSNSRLGGDQSQETAGASTALRWS